MTMGTDLDNNLIETLFEAIAAAIQNRCYTTMDGMKALERQLRSDLDAVRDELNKVAAN